MTCGTKDGKPHIYTPLQAMRRKCLDCCCGSSAEVKLCVIKDCALYPYRLGKHPTIKRRKLTEEEVKKRLENLSRPRTNGKNK